MSLKERYTLATPTEGKKSIIRSSHTTIVFTRYITLLWQNHCHHDDRTLGGIFYE
jgi:hypothetical protein